MGSIIMVSRCHRTRHQPETTAQINSEDIITLTTDSIHVTRHIKGMMVPSFQSITNIVTSQTTKLSNGN